MAEPFFWGQGGAKLTPEQLALARAVLARKKSQGVDTSPVGHWTAGAARVVDALGDVVQERRLNNQQAENDQYNVSQTEPLIAALTGGSAAPVASSGSVSAPDNTAAIAAASGILPSSFLAAVDKTEGGGTYDTLYGHAQKNGPFAGTSISSMPIRDVLAFTDPSGAYAQSVKSQIGRVATPVGRYQVVGSTLKNAVGALGLDPNAPFDQSAQDNVALYLAKNRVSSANTPQGKIAALRNEWHGFKSVPDSEMLKIVSDLESAPTGSRAPVASTAAQAIEQAAPSPGYWIMLDNQMQFIPPVSSGTTAEYYYVSKNIVIDGDTGIRKAQFEKDSDLFLLDESLITLGLIWRWRAMKRLDYAEDMQNYEIRIQQVSGEDKGSRIVRMGKSIVDYNAQWAYPRSLGI